MNNIVQILKKVGLFLFGILLIIWGYKVNAANIEAKIIEEKESNNKEVEQQPVKIPSADENLTETEPSKEQTKKEAVPKAAADKKAVPQAKAKAPVSTPTKASTPVVEKKTENTPVEGSTKVEEPEQIGIEKATPEESSGTE